MTTVTILSLVVSSLMTSCRTAPRSKVPQRRMTLTALGPPVEMIARVNPEICRIVIHRIRRKHGRAVAHRTIVRELLCHVVGIGHSLVVCRVAHIAIRVVQLVVPVHMARLALERRVCAGQRECGRAVVKGCGSPGGC